MKLDTLEIGKDAVVASVTSDDQALRQHILDMGLTPGTEVTMMKYRSEERRVGKECLRLCTATGSKCQADR